jgi:hypothetical protein
MRNAREKRKREGEKRKISLVCNFYSNIAFYCYEPEESAL